MIVIKDIAKSFGDVKAVRGVSFNAENGMITTLLGANGSGKTTTFRSITGLMKPDGGTVHIDGINVREKTLEAQAKLGVFPDQFGLYTRLTTREHIAYYAGLHGLSGSAQDDAINEVAKLMNLEDIIDRRTEGFSQGQRMKVALARAIVHKPQNIILDEPTRGLDVMNIRLLRDILLALKAEGHCILMSSHVMAEVDALSDHIVIMSDGLVCAEGTSASLVSESKQENLEEAFIHLTEEAKRNAA
jgi:sodium transport system ATP-binding protein